MTVICPGPVRTPIFDTARTGEGSEALDRRLRRLERRLITPEQAARRYLRGMERNRAVITGSGLVNLPWWLHRLSPALSERLIGRREMRRFFAETGRGSAAR